MGRLALSVLVVLSACHTALAQSHSVRAPDGLSFGSLFRDLGQDLRRLPSVETAIILGTGGGLATWVHSEDAEITQRWHASLMLDRVFEPSDTMGSGLVQVGGAFGTYALGRLTGNARVSGLGRDLIRSQMLNAVLTQGIKVSTRRRRPDGAQFSFPSGHSSATFATATVLQRRFGWGVGAPAFALAGYVGASRLQENRHYLSDVLFGAAVGIVSGRTATIGRGAATFSVTPTAGPGTLGLVFTRAERP